MNFLNLGIPTPAKMVGTAADKVQKAAILAVIAGTTLGIKSIKRESYLRDAAQLSPMELEQWMATKGMLPNEKNKFRKELGKFLKMEGQGSKKRGLIRVAKIVGATGAAAAGTGTLLGVGAGSLAGAGGALALATPALATAGLVGGLGYGSYHGVQAAYHGGRQIKKKFSRKSKPSRRRTKRSHKSRKSRKKRRRRSRKPSRRRTKRRCSCKKRRRRS